MLDAATGLARRSAGPCFAHDTSLSFRPLSGQPDGASECRAASSTWGQRRGAGTRTGGNHGQDVAQGPQHTGHLLGGQDAGPDCLPGQRPLHRSPQPRTDRGTMRGCTGAGDGSRPVSANEGVTTSLAP